MKLHESVIGDSEPDLAFCHGLFGQGKNWTRIAKALTPAHTSLLLDMPNHGRSPWTDSVDYAAWADLVAEQLRRYAPIDLVGHSMGGKIAMQVALRHPDLVRRLVVVDISPVDYRGLTSFTRYVEGMQDIDLDSLTSRGDADDLLAQRVRSGVIRGFLLQNLRRDKDHWRWQMNLQLLGAHLDDLGGWPPTEATFDRPVLWVAGANSDYIQPGYREAMRRLFPKVRSVTIKGAGHWVHSEQPEAFVAVLQKFLGDTAED